MNIINFFSKKTRKKFNFSKVTYYNYNKKDHYTSNYTKSSKNIY